MANAAIFAAGISLIAADAQRVRIDLHKLKFYRSRIEPTDTDELRERNEQRKAKAQAWLDNPLSPVIVRDGDFAIANGNERVMGLLLLGVEEIEVSLLPASTPDSELDAISLLDDFHKATLKPIERAMVAKRLLDATGMKKGELATKLRIDQSYLSMLLSLFKCPQEVVVAAEGGRIGPDDWYACSKSPAPLETLNIKLGGGSRADVRRSAKTRPAEDGKPPEQNDRLPIPMGTSVVLVKARKGQATLDLAATKTLLIDALAKVDAAIRAGYGIKTAAKAWADTKDRPKKPKAPRQKRAKAD